MITYIGHNIRQRIYLFDTDTEQQDFENYWNDRPAAMQDGNGCRGIAISMLLWLFVLVLILIALYSCAPLHHRPARYPHTVNNIHLHQYNYWGNIKAKYRKAYAPKKSFNPSIK